MRLRIKVTISPMRQAGLAGLMSLAMLALLTLPAFAEESQPNWQISANPSYSRGDYGGDTTTSVLYLPFSVKRLFSFGELSVTVPFVTISSNDLITFVGGDRSGGGGSNSGSGSSNSGSGSSGQADDDEDDDDIDDDDDEFTTKRTKKTESGLGDVTLSARYYLLDEQEWLPSINVTGRIKFPTANEKKGLGSGEFDEGLGVELAKSLTRDLILYLDGGYTFLGDPKGRNFRNQWNYDVGLGYYLTDNLRTSVFYEEFRAVVKGIPNPRDVYGDLNYRITKTIRVNVGGFVGLSESAADFGLSGGLRFRF